MSTSFLPGADDELRERVAVEIARLQVRRALQDTSAATGHTDDLRSRSGHLGALAQKDYFDRGK